MPPILPLPVREQALELVQSLPLDASWDDLMYQIYVRQAIEQGLDDSAADRVVSIDELSREFGLAE